MGRITFAFKGLFVSCGGMELGEMKGGVGGQGWAYAKGERVGGATVGERGPGIDVSAT